MIDLASSMISEGRGSELMPREADPTAPITAYRYVCHCFSRLYDIGGSALSFALQNSFP